MKQSRLTKTAHDRETCLVHRFPLWETILASASAGAFSSHQQLRMAIVVVSLVIANVLQKVGN